MCQDNKKSNAVKHFYYVNTGTLQLCMH